MTSAAPAVALLFDDVELGTQLREALNERGARIVHEGAVSSLTRELLEQVGADVLVVNLDDVADDALDNLYEAIDGTSRKVVFNDGQASSALTGWDRARWARHLALKVFEVGEIDPPRPDNAPGFTPDHATNGDAPGDVAAPSAEAARVESDGFSEPHRESVPPVLSGTPATAASAGVPGQPVDILTADSFDAFSLDLPAAQRHEDGAPDADLHQADAASKTAAPATITFDELDFPDSPWSLDDEAAEKAPVETALDDSLSLDGLPESFEGVDDLQGHTAKQESESLAAELEALLAFDDQPADDEPASGSGLRFSNDDEPPMLHDGHFGLFGKEASDVGVADDEDDPFAFDLKSSFGEKAPSIAEVETRPSSVTPPAFQLDHLELTPLMDAVVTTINSPGQSVKASYSAPSSWSLIDEDVAAAAAPAKASPSEFGIEKISAADFLAPDVGNADNDDELVMSLDRLSLEEAVAPKLYEDFSGLDFDVDGDALGRVVLMGAAASGVDSVCDFLAALPTDTRMFFLHTQHLGLMSAETMVAKLAIHSSLPVRLATKGSRASAGEVLVVPSGQQLRLRRDGSVDLHPSETNAAVEPSIDASFSMAAGVFLADALAIIFAGRGNDGVAGAQAVHDRGGKVWVEASTGEQPTDMVSGIVAERLVSFSGSPQQLAAHLIEVYP